MGGYGSGRPSNAARRIENYRELDISRMSKSGCLREGSSGLWQWRRDDKVTASVNYRFSHDTLHLNYRIQISGGAWEEVSEEISIDWRACRFGGRRPYLVCPGVRLGKACARRVLKLQGASRWFLCRHCCGLRYTSQSEDEFDRAFRRADTLRRKLKVSGGMFSVAPRPRGMWTTTYHRLVRQICELDERADQKLQYFAAKLAKLERRS